jgi:hypothetical protein
VILKTIASSFPHLEEVYSLLGRRKTMAPPEICTAV